MTTQGGSDRERIDALELEVAQLRARSARPRTRVVLAAAVALSLGITAAATGVTGSPLLEGSRNPAVGAASSETRLVGDVPGFTARLENIRGGDGGALAATCRGSAASEACVAGANFLGGGRAFDFHAGGPEVGRITASSATARPFTTNATGVATGLNSDKVDGQDAAALTDVLGSGVLSRKRVFDVPFPSPVAGPPCISDNNCPLLRNTNVTSVRRHDGQGIYCIKVAGTDPRRHTLIAGLNGGDPASVAVQIYGPDDPAADESCDSATEFEVWTMENSVGHPTPFISFWFAVLK